MATALTALVVAPREDRARPSAGADTATDTAADRVDVVALSAGHDLIPETVTVPLVTGRPLTDGPGPNVERGGKGGLEPAPSGILTLEPGVSSVALRAGVGRRFALRSNHEDGWTEWVEVAVEVDEGPDDTDVGEIGEGAHIGPAADRALPAPAATIGPIWLGHDATQVELIDLTGGQAVEVIMLGDAADRGVLRPSPRPTPAVAERSVGAAAQPVVPAADATLGATVPRPVIRPRSDWTDAGWDQTTPGCGSGPGVADRLAAVVVHHTVTTNRYGPDDVDDILRSIHTLHVAVNGWCDIGYNFVLDRFGRIWEGRTGSVASAVVGGHARGFNTSTVGVALLGQHHPRASPTAARPTSATTAALTELARWKLDPYQVDPLGLTWLYNTASVPPLKLTGHAWHRLPTVVGHRDLGLTSCPGDHGYDLVRSLPLQWSAGLERSLPLSFSHWSARSHGPAIATVHDDGGLRPAGAATPWSRAPGPHRSPTVAVGGGLNGGYLLRTDGTLSAFGGSPAVVGRPAGERTVIDLAVTGDGASGWILTGDGRLVGFGASSNATGPGVSGAVAVALDPGRPDPRGYIVDGDGRLHPVGGTPGLAPIRAGAPVVDLAMGPATLGQGPTGKPAGLVVHVLDEGGAVHRLEPGKPVRVTVAPSPARPVAIVASPSEVGAWVVDSAGYVTGVDGARRILPASTDVGADSITDAAVLGHPIPADFLNGPDAAFIEALHERFVGTTPSPFEIDRAVARLEDGVPRTDLVRPLVLSEHWMGLFIDELYLDVLGRRSEDRGRRFWLARLASGLPYAELGARFYASPEYVDGAGTTTAYVTSLYRNLLHRRPEKAGLDHWSGVLNQPGAEPADVVAAFYRSPESRQDRARRLYRLVLGREPTTAEVQIAATRLRSGDDVTLATALAASPEFYRRAADPEKP